MYIHVDTPDLEIFSLNAEVVSQLPLLVQEISIILVVKSQAVLSERTQLEVLHPVDVPA